MGGCGERLQRRTRLALGFRELEELLEAGERDEGVRGHGQDAREEHDGEAELGEERERGEDDPRRHLLAHHRGVEREGSDGDEDGTRADERADEGVDERQAARHRQLLQPHLRHGNSRHARAMISGHTQLLCGFMDAGCKP